MSSGFIDKFSEDAGGYRSGRPVYPSALFEALAAASSGRAFAWDAGCGNGQASIGLAAIFDRVHATDASDRQIAEAIAHERVRYAVEPAERVSLPDKAADLVLVAQALHWFHLDLFYREVRRVLKPSGVLAAVGYDWMYVTPAIDAEINDRLMPVLAPHWASNNALLWAGYRSIAFPGEEVRVGAHAIYLDWRFADLWAYVCSWSATRAAREAGCGGDIELAQDRLSRAWGGETRRVVMPLHIRAARIV